MPSPRCRSGNYRVTVTAGGCFTSTTVDLDRDGDTTLDVTLPQRADGYGYTCLVEGAGYVEGDTAADVWSATTQLPRSHLPFPFFFYGATYSRAFVSTNGHLNFLAPIDHRSATPPFPRRGGAQRRHLPALGRPGGAEPPARSGPGPREPHPIGRSSSSGGTSTSSTPRPLLVDFEVQLNEDGSIVTRYRNLGADPRERGNSATVGIENATRHRRIAVLVQLPGALGRSVDPVRPAADRHDRRQVTDANDGQGRSRARRCARCQGTTAGQHDHHRRRRELLDAAEAGCVHGRGRPSRIT